MNRSCCRWFRAFAVKTLPVALVILIGSAAIGNTAFAQIPSVTVDVLSRITDLSLNPNFNNLDDNHVVTGSPAVLVPIVAAESDVFGHGTSNGKAKGSAGVMHVNTFSHYDYVPDSVGQGGYSSITATVDITDYITPFSGLFPKGTVVPVVLNFGITGGVSVPYSDQLRPGITADVVAHMDANSSVDSKFNTYTFPSSNNPLTGFSLTLNAKIGEAFSLRYSLAASTYLSGNIPDYRDITSDFSHTGLITIQPQDPTNVSISSASGYSYQGVQDVPEPGTACLIAAVATVGLGLRLRRKA